MPRTWWRDLQKWQRVSLVLGAGVAVLAIVAAVLYLNLIETQSLMGSSPSTASVGGTVDWTAETAENAERFSRRDGTLFQGSTISLELPAWFFGGDPRDLDVRAVLEGLLGIDLNEWLDLYAQSSLELDDVELLMAGMSEAGGETILVTAVSEEMPTGSSLEEYAEELGAWFADEDVSVEMLTEDRAYCYFVFRRADDSTESMVSRMALLAAGGRVHVVSYTAPAESSGTLDSVFDVSAGTIVLLK